MIILLGAILFKWVGCSNLETGAIIRLHCKIFSAVMLLPVNLAISGSIGINRSEPETLCTAFDVAIISEPYVSLACLSNDCSSLRALKEISSLPGKTAYIHLRL
ncbi:hypothetical protein [Ranid herpesvirus 3]|uniref:Uncharacterized protein n=1 Tax=Ranid herpesvirus 3 TaxID=1987509 RepID=A0A1X9T5B5_9VIRU|nr:hypothetical protein [Ranid herpesvirus 3]ARR28891.1 hypothetical protein [Ranid herpesvirus 3]